MKKKTLIFSLAFAMLTSIGYCQVVSKETIEKDGVKTNGTISESGMYAGTKSDDAKLFFKKAGDYEKKNDLKNAKKYYQKAIKEDPNYIEAYDNLGLVYRKLGEYDKAIEYYNESIKRYPKGQMAHQNLAVVYLIQRDYKSAQKEYKLITEIEPNDPRRILWTS